MSGLQDFICLRSRSPMTQNGEESHVYAEPGQIGRFSLKSPAEVSVSAFVVEQSAE